MQILAALFLFSSLAAATPIETHDPTFSARQIVSRYSFLREGPPIGCGLAPFLKCNGGNDQQVACQDTAGWACSVTGASPATANVTCAAECVSAEYFRWTYMRRHIPAINQLEVALVPGIGRS
ncbi:hypothetical protein FB45DRAFT_870310 [Roridomyces roridus]|uniref:Uncharacterized protein n=1 Tax=Roridomyces roridus TaxID=1738132 RepID=A0AAD7FG19_9AGAR|nr:hypothetical protein FB45DRAFT_870310 [Roridomyces roridus]